MGRPRSLDQSAKDQILAVITDGGSRGTAAAIVGCHTSTIANEAARDERFLDALKRAEAECEMFHVRRIKEGKPAWQSSAWFLERKFWKRWKKRDDAAAPSASRDDILQLAKAMVSAQAPPGARAFAGQLGAVQDRAGGTA